MPYNHIPDYYSRLPTLVELPGLTVNESLECMSALLDRLEHDQTRSTRDLVSQVEHCLQVMAHCLHEAPSSR